MKSEIMKKKDEVVSLKFRTKNEQIEYLWQLLDDISTAGDMFKPELSDYFRYVDSKCEERGNIANSPDGFKLEIIELDLSIITKPKVKES